MQRTVIVSNFGSFISKKSERMVIKDGSQVIEEIVTEIIPMKRELK